MAVAPQQVAATRMVELYGPAASFLLPLMFLWAQRQLAQGITLAKTHARKSHFLFGSLPGLLR